MILIEYTIYFINFFFQKFQTEIFYFIKLLIASRNIYVSTNRTLIVFQYSKYLFDIFNKTITVYFFLQHINNTTYLNRPINNPRFDTCEKTRIQTNTNFFPPTKLKHHKYPHLILPR